MLLGDPRGAVDDCPPLVERALNPVLEGVVDQIIHQPLDLTAFKDEDDLFRGEEDTVRGKADLGQVERGAPVDQLSGAMSSSFLEARDDREAFRRFDQSVGGPAPLLDLAWFTADGKRSVEDIAQLVWAETGRWEPETLSTWFQWAERLGIGELRGG